MTADTLEALVLKIVRETDGAPSMILMDGQPYKVIPTALADELAALVRAGGVPQKLPPQWNCPYCGYGEYKNREDWQRRVAEHIEACNMRPAGGVLQPETNESRSPDGDGPVAMPQPPLHNDGASAQCGAGSEPADSHTKSARPGGVETPPADATIFTVSKVYPEAQWGGVEPPAPHEACPCLHTTPCDPRCTCIAPTSSRGCRRCCSYGSPEQQRKMAEYLAERLGVDTPAQEPPRSVIKTLRAKTMWVASDIAMALAIIDDLSRRVRSARSTPPPAKDKLTDAEHVLDFARSAGIPAASPPERPQEPPVRPDTETDHETD